VKIPDRPSLGIVDAGRLGSSLAAALYGAGYRVSALSRRDPTRAHAAAGRLGTDVFATDRPQEVVDRADVVFLTTVDDRIAPLAAELRFRAGQTVLHCSGATPVAALATAERAGALVGGLHPLQTFPDEHGAGRFAGITFGIEALEPGLLAWLQALAEGLGGRAVVLDPASRPLYHASAVMIGPLTAALAGLAADLWHELGHDREAALHALAPLLQHTAQSVAALGIPAALTGPFVRGDVEPVRRHLRALADALPETGRAYAALALAQLPIAAERGNIPGDRMHELRALLEAAAHTPGH